MFTRELARKAWSDAGLYADPDPQLREFLDYFDTHPTDCWEMAAAVFRDKYYKLYDRVVPPLANSSDTMLRLQFIRHADPARPRELKTLKDIAARADPALHRPELNALLALNHRRIKSEIARRKDLAPILAPPREPSLRPVTNVLRPPPRPRAGEHP